MLWQHETIQLDRTKFRRGCHFVSTARSTNWSGRLKPLLLCSTIIHPLATKLSRTQSMGCWLLTFAMKLFFILIFVCTEAPGRETHTRLPLLVAMVTCYPGSPRRACITSCSLNRNHGDQYTVTTRNICAFCQRSFDLGITRNNAYLLQLLATFSHGQGRI